MQSPERTLSLKSQAARQAPVQLNVVYTGRQAARAALEETIRFAAELNARIRVIVLLTVPYPIPLDTPPVDMRFERARILSFVSESAPDASVLICYCRDEVDAIRYLLGFDLHWLPRSIIVIAGKKRRWFPTRAQRIAGKLEEAGHRVLFVDPGGSHA